jgi:hypothetical protein
LGLPSERIAQPVERFAGEEEGELLDLEDAVLAEDLGSGAADVHQ